MRAGGSQEDDEGGWILGGRRGRLVSNGKGRRIWPAAALSLLDPADPAVVQRRRRGPPVGRRKESYTAVGRALPIYDDEELRRGEPY